jgi:hypothetical protein
MADQCLQYQDIFEEIPSGTSAEETKTIKARNEKNERLYKAVRYVLKNNFDLKDAIPEDPKSFATAKLADADRAQFIAILGLMQADNWDDPRNGKERPSPDDLLYPGHSKETAFVIDRRFVDAVVDAVKEYTAASKLFNNVFALMRDESSEGFTKPRSSAS